MTEEVLFKTYDLLEKIKNMNEYLRMKELKEIIKEEHFDLLNEFNRLKIRFNETDLNKCSYEYKELCSKLSSVKEELYNKSSVKEYRKLEKVIQAYLDAIHNNLVNVARGE